MVRLREIPRTAAFAWSPGTAKPLLVTGTRAGAVDADFSDETKLELWDLNLDNAQQGLELLPIASISTDSRFFDIAWGPPNEDHPRGIIAGALENGSLDLWDAEKLIAGASDAAMSRTSKHSGAIKSLQFNPLKPQILATAGTKGELFIYDVSDISNPFRLGTAAARSDDLECVAWNRKVPHILATGGSGGFVTVWDLKTKKASLTLNNSRKAVSAIAWDPNNSTKLLTATPDDNLPVIFLWDLRNSNAPERTLQGHEQGVLSVSWCQQDSDLLISCGKDNRTLVWNPQTGERYGEFPEVTNWTFLTRFSPSNPNLSATASFDGKITIQTLQNTNPSTAQAAAQSNLDGEDFFTKAQTQPQGASFTLAKAPAWFQRPVGASFGFGGKLVVFRKNQTAAGQPRSSRVVISHFSVDSGVGEASQKFEEALKSGDMGGICKTHLGTAKTEEEKSDWKVMETLLAQDPRKQVIEYLGFSAEDDEATGTSRNEDDGATAGVEVEAEAEAEAAEGKQEKEEVEEEAEEVGELPAPAPAPAAAASGEGLRKHKKNRLSTFFADGDDFLSELAATKGAKTNSPFHLFKEGNTSLEDSITKALMLGNFAKAVEICLREERMADAFLIANCGGKELVERVQATYISQKKGQPSYLRLLGSVIAENLWDVVYNADLADWKETMATLCTFAKPAEFPDLCEALGDRILETGSRSRKDASFCYLVGSKLEKVVDIWISELDEAVEAETKESTGDSNFSVHARLLQVLIEKVTVFRQVTKFQDSELGRPADWKLGSLYDKYVEYADVVSAHGQLAVAQKYLDLVPGAYPAADLARNRVRLATQRAAAPQPSGPTTRSQGSSTARATSRQQHHQPLGYHHQPRPAQPTQPAQPAQPGQHTSQNPYAPPTPGVQAQAPSVSANTYGPASASLYAPAGASLHPQQAPSYAPPQLGGAYGPSGAYGQPQPGFGGTPPPPSRNITPSAAPPRPRDVGTWNDVPMVAKAPPVRRTTPSIPPVTSPFNQSSSAPPPPSPFGSQRGTGTPPPPPPKASAPPRVTSPLTGPPQSSHMPGRPPSAAAASYAPPPLGANLSGLGGSAAVGPPLAGHAMPPPRTASPYNVPPSAAPPSNRYAPAPALQQQGGHPPQNSMPPPPANPYAPVPQQSAALGTQAHAHGQYAPPAYDASAPQAGRPPVGPPPSAASPTGPTGPPRGGPPPSAAGGASPTPPPPPRAAASPAPARHPPGDRSHMPASAQPLVDILSRDMRRVAAKAPSSFAPQVKDTQKRLNILFDHLNNEELIKPNTIAQLAQIAEAIESKNYHVAQRLQVEIQTEKTTECGQWMTGVKRLISMSKATP